MTISEEINGDTKTIIVSGKVDSITSGDLQNYMLNSFMTYKNIAIDFADVVYVSSAGLRVFLLGQKTAASKGGTFVLKNVNDVVMSVLKTVGMEKILTIQ